MGKLGLHPVCKWFPEMEPEDLQKLADDIKENGQQLPILVWDNQICDGRNRELACEIAGVKPQIKQMKHEPTPAEIVALNLHRRHLTLGQRLEVASNLREHYAKFGKQRKRENLKNPRKSTEGTTTVPSIEVNGDNAPGKALERAAAEAGVSHTTLQKYDMVKDKDPELAEAIQEDEITVAAAVRQVESPPKATTTKKDDFPKDQLGNKLPEKFQAAFADLPKFRAICRKINETIKECEELAASAGGVFLTMAAIRADLNNAKSHVRTYEPFTACHYCKSKGCSACKNNGWVYKRIHEQKSK